MNLTALPLRTQLVLIGALLLLSSIISALLFPTLGPEANTLLVIPVLVAAYLTDLKWVLLVILTGIVFHWGLLRLGGYPEWPPPGSLRGLVTLLLVGVAAAQLFQMNRRQQQYLHERSTIYRDRDKRNAELAALQEAGLQITQSLELEPILQKIVEMAVKLVQAKNVQVHLYDGRVLTFGAAYWGGQQQTKSYSEPRQDGATYSVARTGQPLFISDVDSHPLYKEWKWGGAIAILPLASGKQINGVMNVGYTEPHHFDESETRILRLLATQAAVAIQNARLYDAVRQQAAHLELHVADRTAELRTAKEWAETVLNNGFDAIIVFNPQAGVEQVNPAFRSLFGYVSEDVTEGTLSELIHPDSRETVLAAMRQVIATAQPARTEATLVRRDGTQFVADIALAAIPSQEHSRPNVICSLRDISDRKKVEEQQRAMTAGLRTVLAVANELMSCPDVDTVMRHAVEAARAQLGMERCAIFMREGNYLRGTYGTDMAGNTTDERENSFPINDMWDTRFGQTTPMEAQWVIAPDDDHYSWSGERAEIVGKGWIALHRIELADGSSGFFINDAAITQRPLDETQQEIVSVFCSLLSKIIERKRVEEDIRWALQHEVELGELKSRFISNISHEFRTPLTIIQSSTQLLKYYHDRMSKSKQDEHLEKVEDQVREMIALLDSVLTISRDEVVGLPYNPRPIDLPSLCNSIVQEIVMTTGASHEISLTHEGDFSNYILDERLVRQIITNLLTNAVKYSPIGSRIQVDLQCEPRQVVIRVRDEGIGIPEEDQKHLFEDFHRGKNVGAISGTGLGLSIVKRAAQAHGGMVSVESTVGVGTSFTVRLPNHNTEAEVYPSVDSL